MAREVNTSTMHNLIEQIGKDNTITTGDTNDLLESMLIEEESR